MSEYDKQSESSSPSELRETPAYDLEFPVPATDLKSWRGVSDPAAALAFSETQLARYWSNPDFVRRRREQRIEVPFEL